MIRPLRTTSPTMMQKKIDTNTSQSTSEAANTLRPKAVGTKFQVAWSRTATHEPAMGATTFTQPLLLSRATPKPMPVIDV